jgi:hypothetical protein
MCPTFDVMSKGNFFLEINRVVCGPQAPPSSSAPDYRPKKIQHSFIALYHTTLPKTHAMTENTTTNHLYGHFSTESFFMWLLSRYYHIIENEINLG